MSIRIGSLLLFSAAISVAFLSPCGGVYCMADTPVANVKAVASSEQVAGLFSANHLVSEKGLVETRPGSGVWELTSEAGTWQSNYLSTGPQETPLVDFDLGESRTIGSFHVWNHTQSHRGMADVLVFASDDGKFWRGIPQAFRFSKVTEKTHYTGERFSFELPVTARWIRFWGVSSHRTGGQPDIAGLSKVRFFEAEKGGKAYPQTLGAFPADAGLVNVKAKPYLAVGDGKADDTDAIQRAIDDTQGTARFIYLPNGVYRVTKTLKWKPGHRHGRNNLRGESRERTVVQLDEKTFTDQAAPQAVLSFGWNGDEPGKRVSADWFHNHLFDLTVEVGSDNAGAVGIQFYSNNVGSLKNVSIKSTDGGGVIGLDLGQIDQNGPHLVKDISVEGFETGVRCGATVNSQTIESLTLIGQTKIGLFNGGQCLSVRGLRTKGSVPAVTSNFGVITLVDVVCEGTGAADKLAAMQTNETLFARNIKTTGFAKAIEHRGKETLPSPEGASVAEYVSSPTIRLAGGGNHSLNLPVKDAPVVDGGAPELWANVRSFREIGDVDDTASIRRALASGAKTVYFSPGAVYFVSGNIEVPSQVNRIEGMFSRVVAVRERKSRDKDEREDEQPLPRLIVQGESKQPIAIECFFANIAIVNPSGRTLVVRNGEFHGGDATDRGELFLENIVCEWTFGKEQTVWARQLNAEKQGVHLTNAGGTLWVLGLKTERGGVLIDTLAGGKTEVLGGLSYTTNQGKLGPMFRVVDGSLSVTLGEVCYTGDPFAVLCEVRSGESTERVKRGEGPLRPSFLQGSALPLLRVGP